VRCTVSEVASGRDRVKRDAEPVGDADDFLHLLDLVRRDSRGRPPFLGFTQ
jgi:hypothetical protein